MDSRKSCRPGSWRFGLAGLAVLCLTVTPMLAQSSKKNTKMANQVRDSGTHARMVIENARDQLKACMTAYDALLESEEKARPNLKKKLTTALGKLEKTVEDGRKQVTDFQAQAGDFYNTWEEQLATIQTPEIKAASEKRLGLAKQLAENMSENLNAASEVYGPMIASLNEQAVLIGKDNSDGALEILNDVAPGIHAKADQVFESIEKALSKETSHESEMDTVMEEEAEAEAEVEVEAEAEE